MSTRAVVLGGAGLVGLATAATSSVSLYRLAVDCSFDWWLAPSLPIALDAGAAVGALAWITERGPGRAWGRGVAVGALVASLAGNGIQHAIGYGLVRPTLLLVLVVGATIPAALWAVVHLAALLSKSPPSSSRGKSPARRGKTSRPAPTTPTNPPAEPTPTELAGRRHYRDEVLPWLQARPVEPYMVEVRAIQAKFGCSLPTAKRLRAEAREVAS